MLEIYGFLYFLLIILVLVSNKGNRPKFIVFIYTVFSFSLFLALRNENAGSDTITYYLAFNRLDGFSFDMLTSYKMFMLQFSQPVEFLYFFSNYILSAIYSDFSFVLFVLLIISFSLLFLFYRSFSEYYLLSVLFLFSSLTYVLLFGNAVRQAIAVGFIFYGLLRYYNNNKKLDFFVIICVASNFHISSLIFVFFPWIKEVSIKSLLSILILFILIGVSEAFKYIAPYIPNQYISNKLIGYFSNSDGFSLFNFSFVSFFIFFAVLYNGCARLVVGSERYNKNFFLLKCYLFVFLFECLLMGSPTVMIRISQMRFLIEPIIIANLLLFIGDKGRNYVFVLFVFLCGLYFYYVINNESVIYNLVGE